VDELEKAEKWYRLHNAETADRWLEAAGQMVDAISDHPELWAADELGIREVLIRPYSYTVVYRLHPDMIEIVAFAHTSRRRRYWKKRLNQG